ncbi:hypothetical protein ACIBG8_34310 [Nonomuraea sp. NPDC050556]|uniref:hypothetical protein n=1 Tax=Nonomuraea sp. NPDC050556 TaxID=3364369 RepID=UPI0037A95596
MNPVTYRPPRDRLWFVRSRAYTVFVLREATSVFVAWATVYVLLLVSAVLSGNLPGFIAFSQQIWVVALNVVALIATAFHSVTFLNLAPKATVVRLDGWRVPAFMIQGGNHSAWIGLSILIAYFIMRSP